jgi:hypothetical protein
MTSIDLQFLPNPGEEVEGLGHAGIETFRNDPHSSAARETGQNSIDARASSPVSISYDLLELSRSDIPGIDALQEAIEICLRSAGSSKDLAFLSNAKRVCAEATIRVLAIKDYNTTGATGPSVPGTAFHSLVKSSGVSVKGHEHSGGSFGIGKNAVFAVSDLRTVFYSTRYTDKSGNPAFLAQGKSILLSHTNSAGQHVRQTGYWGFPKFEAVSDPGALPEWLKREELGTSVYVIGFQESTDWRERLTCSLIQNFFSAIHKSEITFSIDKGNHKIGAETLESFLNNPALRDVAAKHDQVDEFDLAVALRECLVSDAAIQSDIELPGIGPVRMRVLVRDGLPKKVVIIRNGMVITDNLQYFGDKLSRFPMYRDFAAIVTPTEDAGSTFIKGLEDPRHKDLSPAGLSDEAARNRAKIVVKRLIKEIRNFIKSQALSEFDSEVRADEMREFFPGSSDEKAEKKKSSDDDPETIEYSLKPRPSTSRPKATAPGDQAGGLGEGGSGQGEGSSGQRKDKTDGDGRGTGADSLGGGGAYREIALEGLRNISRSSTERIVFFTSPEAGKIELSLKSTGLAQKGDLVIKSCNGFVVTNGRLRADVAAGSRTRLDVVMEEPYDGPIEIQASLLPVAET